MRAALEELTFHCIPCARARRANMRPRLHCAAELLFQLAERGEVERVRGEPIDVGDRRNLGEPSLRSLILRDSDCAIERHHRRWPQPHQGVIELDDHPPIRILQRARTRVNRRDCGLYVKLGNRRSRRRMIEQPFALGNELTIP